MSNVHISFLYPELFLLLIPAAALVLWLYLRLSKKYRRTRNRIISIIFQLCVLVLSACVLAGTAISYKESQKTNEMILLVDLSHSNRESEDKKDDFIKSVLAVSESSFLIGIVSFGKDQIYEAKLSTDTDRVYEQYRAAPRPDSSATDVASALTFTAKIFDNPSTAKIVLLTDGIETDNSALSVIMSIVSEGIRVDTVHFGDEYGPEVQIIAVETPDYNIVVDDPVKIGVTLQSSYAGMVSVTLHDNGVESASITVPVNVGIDTFYLEYAFGYDGPHEICFKIASVDDKDTIAQNNVFYSYIFLQVFDNILIIDGGNESSRLAALIDDNFDYNVRVFDRVGAPKTLLELAEYDQIILMNMSNTDLSLGGFDELLYSYVNDCGGGLLTVGGDKAYGRADMRDELGRPTLYQQMLPVDCVDWTPPIAVMFTIDVSSSMDFLDAPSNKTRMELAKDGIKEALRALSERDYVGIVTFAGTGTDTVRLPLTPVTQMGTILNAINGLTPNGSTIYRGGIQRAGEALQAFRGVDRKHIMFVSDGEPNDQPGNYEPLIEHYNINAGITLSAIGIAGADLSASSTTLQQMATLGKGRAYAVEEVKDLPQIMYDELRQETLKEFNHKPFNPVTRGSSSVLLGLIGEEMPQLLGFYGTRAKPGAEVSLAVMEYGTPIFAQWKLGKGKVASFMCDLNGTWSDAFLRGENGIKFIHNVIKGLFPAESVEPRDIDAKFINNNFNTQIHVYSQTTISEEDTVSITITGLPIHTYADPSNPTNNTMNETVMLDTTEDFLRHVFTLPGAGIYEVEIQRRNGETVIAKYTTYVIFSYSDEYNVFDEYNAFIDQKEGLSFLANLSRRGKGAAYITENGALFRIIDDEEVASSVNDIVAESMIILDDAYDLCTIFMTIALILFLLDIAVRKFKFKWPWEIVRDYRIKKTLKESGRREAV